MNLGLQGKLAVVSGSTAGIGLAIAAALAAEGAKVVVNGRTQTRVDAAINDNGALYSFVTANPDTEVTAEFNTGEQYGFAAKKDDPSGTKLLTKFNDLLTKAKADGTYNQIFKKWFGVEPKK